MSKLNCNYQNIQANTLPKLDSSIDYLGTALKSLNNTFIPNAYYGKGDLQGIIEDIDHIKNDIAELIAFIENSKKKLSSIKDENCVLVNQIQETVMKKRVKIVNNT